MHKFILCFSSTVRFKILSPEDIFLVGLLALNNDFMKR